MRPFFITGIGTGVGKTLVSAIVTEAIGGWYWKPVQAGFDVRTHAEWVGERLSRRPARGDLAGTSRVLPEAYKLRLPASPHIAAREEGVVIAVSSLAAELPEERPLVVEGAGGLLVPLNDGEFMADLALALDATVIGRGFYATGEAKHPAYLSGIPVRRYVIASFCICAVFATLAAIMATAGGGKADLRVGVNFLMPAYASVYLGAAVFGRPSAPATLLGSAFMTTLIDGFTLLGVPYYYADAVVSGALLLAVVLSNRDLQRAVAGALGKAGLGLERNR